MPEDRKDRREKMAKEAKTNAMRMLDRQKVKYEAFSYECDEFIDGRKGSYLFRSETEKDSGTV